MTGKTENSNLKRHIVRLLMEMGFSPRHFGFGYIREMIFVAYHLNNINMTRIYTHIALKYDVLVPAAQTAIRTALASAQAQKSFYKLENLLGVSFIEKNCSLTPREFLGIILEYLMYVWDGKSELPHN